MTLKGGGGMGDGERGMGKGGWGKGGGDLSQRGVQEEQPRRLLTQRGVPHIAPPIGTGAGLCMGREEERYP